MPEGSVTERRRHERVPVRLSATLTRVGRRAQVEDVATVDLSEGGAGVEASEAFAVGDVVVLSVAAEGVSIEHQGLVVGRRPADAEGRTVVNIAFKTMSDQTLRSLRRLLALA